MENLPIIDYNNYKELLEHEDKDEILFKVHPTLMYSIMKGSNTNIKYNQVFEETHKVELTPENKIKLFDKLYEIYPFKK